MVSTRKAKDKFSEGDQVLCYEPDPTKTKVLYDSKVLEVKARKDERGRRVVEYLVHFKGWNPSWDRVVNEDFILKDTEENRKLQRDLAVKARLQIGAYLYRKEQSENGSKLSDESFDKVRSQESEAADEEWTTASDEDDDDNASSVETDDSLDQRVPLDLTPALRNFLEKDFHYVKGQNKLVKLPASPNVIQILESYIRHVASRAFHTNEDESGRPRGRGQQAPLAAPNKADELEWLTAKMNIAKEVVDGVRICFDFYLASQLLYSTEVKQHEQVQMGLINIEPERDSKCVLFSEDETSKSDDPFISCNSANVQLALESADTDRRKSLRSHKETEGPSSVNGVGGKPFTLLDRAPSAKSLQNSTNNAPSVKSCSSASSYLVTLGDTSHLASGGGPLAPEIAQQIKLAESWRLVPDSYLQEEPPHPSTVYGFVHLCRLFVKLPSIIYLSNLPNKENQPRHLSEEKMNLLLSHLQNFIKYLEGKTEWIGDHLYYQSDVDT